MISLIYKLQKYFKIDLLYLIKGESWLLVGKVINMATTFVLVWAWANWIDKEVYGNYQYIFSLIGIISIFSLHGIGLAVTQAVARGFEGSFIRGFKVQLKWGLLASLSALIIAGYYWVQGNKNFPLAFLVVAVFLFLFNALLIYTSFLTGKKLFGVQVRYESIIQIIAVLAMLIALFLAKTSLNHLSNFIILLLLVSVYFVFRTFLNFIFFIRTKTRFSPNKKEDPKTIGYGKHLSLSELGEIITNNLDKILLFHYLGAVELAIYIFASLLPQQIKVFLKHINSLIMPKLSTRSKESIKKTLLKKTSYLAILITGVVLVYIILAPYIYQIFFPKYLEAVNYSRIYALSIIPLAFSSIMTVFMAKMMVRQVYQARITLSLVRAGLFVIFIPLYGIWGAVLAVLGVRLFSAFLFVFLFKKAF